MNRLWVCRLGLRLSRKTTTTSNYRHTVSISMNTCTRMKTPDQMILRNRIPRAMQEQEKCYLIDLIQFICTSPQKKTRWTALPVANMNEKVPPYNHMWPLEKFHRPAWRYQRTEDAWRTFSHYVLLKTTITPTCKWDFWKVKWEEKQSREQGWEFN